MSEHASEGWFTYLFREAMTLISILKWGRYCSLLPHITPVGHSRGGLPAFQM
jgi:hypothetical protein